MALLKLTVREVNGQPFKSTHIEIIDKLYDSHRALYSPSLDVAFLVPAYRPSRQDSKSFATTSLFTVIGKGFVVGLHDHPRETPNSAQSEWSLIDAYYQVIQTPAVELYQQRH